MLTFSKEEEETERVRAARALGAKIKMPGFRPGKAPLEELLRHIDPQQLLDRVVRMLVKTHLAECIAKEGINPIIPPRIALKSLAPLSTEITLIERPDIQMSSPKKLTDPRKGINVTAKEIDTVIEELQKKESLKELTDELVKKHWEVPTVAEFKKQVEKSIYMRKQREGQQKQEQELFQNVVSAVKTKFPEELIEEEAQRMLENMLQRLSNDTQREQWLKKQEEHKDQFIKELNEEAEKQLKFQFGIAKLTKDMNISISHEEMQESITAFLQMFPQKEQENIREQCHPGGSAYQQLHWQKTIEKVKKELTPSAT